ncbi:MAG: hypothetical protein ABI210_14650, partial [Abditibacteriaceae bacterium]
APYASVVLVKTPTVTPPTANAGSDQTIYLTQGSTVTLDGSKSSGDAYRWTEVSTDYKSKGQIISPTSATTQVTGLPQGVFYFQLTVIKNGLSAKDIAVVRVDYDVPPANSTLLRELPITNPDFIKVVNIRDDNTRYWGYTNDPTLVHTEYSKWDSVARRSYHILIDRGHLSNMRIDGEKGKLYATVQDGWPWAEPMVTTAPYTRAELTFGSGSEGFTLDNAKTYVFEWKGYYPQKFDFMKSGKALTIFQLHPLGPTGTLFQYSIDAGGGLIMQDNINGAWTNNVDLKIANISDFYNQTHTIRTTIREGEGKPGQTAFIKVEVDGVQKYFRDSGIVGTGLQTDYIKFGGIYDYDNNVVSGDPHMRSRGREATIVTESFRVYTIPDATPDRRKSTAANAPK